MKRFCKDVQAAGLIALVVSVVVAAFLPVMYYVAAAAMVVMAVSAVAEPNSEPACPMIFTEKYRELHNAA